MSRAVVVEVKEQNYHREQKNSTTSSTTVDANICYGIHIKGVRKLAEKSGISSKIEGNDQEGEEQETRE